MSSSHYIHGTSPEEQQRLTAMNHLLNERFLAQAALAPGERIVDFGAGLGPVLASHGQGNRRAGCGDRTQQ